MIHHLRAKVALKNLTGVVLTVPKAVGGNMQVKTVYPTYEDQYITADTDTDENYMGLSLVIVKPKPRPLNESFLTDGYYNLIASANDFTPGGILEAYIPKMYSYNGTVLPEIPAGVLAIYPYVWLGKSASNGNYLFYACKVKWWYKSSNSTFSATSELVIYRADQDEWTYVNKITGGDFTVANFSNLWSNHDIPNGSATATTIYFKGSEPVLVE